MNALVLQLKYSINTYEGVHEKKQKGLESGTSWSQEPVVISLIVDF